MGGHENKQIRAEILTVLERLRGRIRGYVLAEGTARVLIVLGLLFWLSLGLDWACFWISRLELPRGVRVAVDLLAVGLLSAGCLLWIVQRSLRVMRPKALALVLERRFPQLDDRLVTSVEIEESLTGRETPLTESMLQRTVDDVTRVAGSLDIGVVFDKSPLKKALIGAGGLLLSIGAFSFAMPEAMGYWWSAYINLDEEYWDRRTEIVVHAETRPNNRVRDFLDASGRPTGGLPGEHKHRRGDDLVLLIEIPEKVSRGKFKGQPAIVPDYVTVRYDFRGTRESDDSILRVNPSTRRTKFTLPAVAEDVEVTVTGGDFTNRRPYRIRAVDAPRLDEIVLRADYPRYTGLNQGDAADGLTNVRVQGLRVEIPAETRFLFHAKVNKPLVNARLEYGQNEIVIGDFYESPDAGADAERTFKATFTTRSLEGGAPEVARLSPETAGRFLSEDRMSLAVPFVVSPGKTEAARERMQKSFPEYGKPFVLPEDFELRVYLEDEDGLLTVDPTKIRITAVPDGPPQFVDVEVTGVSNIITRRADVPVKGMITDQYGIATARFEYQVDEETEVWSTRPLDNPPEGLPLEFKLQRSEDEEVERFSVSQLDLQVGQKLILSLYAEDDDNLNGPHGGRSKKFAFTVVTPEELQGQFYDRELAAKGRMEQIRREVEQTRRELEFQQERLEEAKRLREQGPEPGKEQEFENRLAAIQRGLNNAAITQLHQVRKNASETAAVEQEFKAILEELENNRVPGGERIKSEIVDPLEGIVHDDFPIVDSSVNQFRQDNEKKRDPTENVDQSVEEIGRMLEHMDGVLAGMQDIVEYHQLVKDLDAIIKQQQEIEKATEQEQKESLRRRLGVE